MDETSFLNAEVRNTEEERGCLKELPWQSGPISLCTYTRTLYLSHSPSSSSHSISPSLTLAFLSFCSLCFPWQWTLESALHVCYVGTARKTERERENGKENKRPWERWVCMCVKLKHFQHSCASVRQTPWSATVLSPKLSPWIKMYRANQNPV